MLFSACLLSFCLCFVLVPPVIALSWRIGAVDVPLDWRRMHRESIARGGGIAVFAAILTATAVMGMPSHPVAATLAGGFLLLLVGLADDIFCLGAWVKLLFQATVALAAVLGSGAVEGRAVIWAVLWVVALTNAHNFVDGLDGLLAGTATIEGVALCIALALLGAGELARVALVLATATLAFRLYNRYPAKVFLGDCGSGTLGFLLGMLSLPLLFTPTAPLAVLSPILIFGYPLTDLGTAVLRRLLRGKNPFAADRAHLHHRISAVGLTHPQCGGALLVVEGGLATVGVLLSVELLWTAAAIACVAAAILLMRVRRFILEFS